MGSRLVFLIIGFLLLIETIYMIVGSLRGDFSASLIIVLIFSISILFLSLGYLYPQFKNKDERMKLIRDKSMFYSYFILMFYFLVFVILLHFEIISLTAYSAVIILASLTIMTVFILFIILSFVF